MAITWDEFGNEVTVQDTAQNQANDDAGKPSPAGQPNVQAAGNPEVNAPSATNAANVTNAGTTPAGQAGTNMAKPVSSRGQSPTVRPNPLGYLSSYTYQLTLYMLTADAVNAFRASGRKNINDLVVKAQGSTGVNGGAYIVCQNGGVNNTTSKRAPGFEYDYYIDNLQLTNLVSPAENQSPTVTTKLSFQIIEPYGFSFLSNLKYAADELDKYSSTLNAVQLDDASRQYFVLGVRFFGYDKHGKLMTGKETIDGRTLDPGGSGNGLYETFYEILFKKVNFKIDGKATVYNIEAISVNSDTLSIKNNVIPTQVSIKARTVEEALTGPTGLTSYLNNYWDTLVATNKVDIGFKYHIEFVGDFNDLKTARMVLPEDTVKYKYPFKSNPKDVIGVEAIPDTTQRLITFSNTPSNSITSAIEKIITQSTYMSDSLKVNYTNDDEPLAQSDGEAEVKPDAVKYFRWFNITTNTKILGYSKNMNDWVYDITFVISPYETPIVISPYVKNLPNYYGPVKRYDYWFTGQNSEIINYEQQNNNGYFIVALDPSVENNDSQANTNTPPKPNPSDKVSNRPTLKSGGDTTGTLLAGGEAKGTITTNLYDPKSYANAKITILGDPDYLVQDSLNYDVATKKFNQFYAPNGTTINPTGGQIFIEIDFKEGVDYEYKTGTMKINESITFWQYPESVKHLIKGVSYTIKKITSNFKGGKFTQDLELIVNQFGDDAKVTSASATPSGRESQDESSAETARLQRQATGSSATTTGNTTGSNTGLKTDQPVANNTPPATQPPTTSPDDPGTTPTSATSEEDAGREIDYGQYI